LFDPELRSKATGYPIPPVILRSLDREPPYLNYAGVDGKRVLESLP